MRALVTGGAGFLGSWLCQELIEEGHEVICMDNLFTSSRLNILSLLDEPRFEFMRHDVCDPWHVECDRIYHLACPASPVHYQRNPVRTMKTAVIGTMNALSCARDAGARMLLASTSEIYGDPQVHPQVEGYLGNVNTLGPRSSYDEGKRAGEALVHSWTQQYKTDVRIARIFNTYGPRMASGDGRLIPNFVNQAIQNKPLTIYGTGEQTRSLCYVDDTVAGLMALMEVESTRLLVDTGSGRISVPVNIGNPDERTVLSIAQAIISNFSGCPGVVHGSALEDDPMRRCPDITRAKEVLGWEPVVNLEAGLLATIRWFQSRVSQ